MDKVFEFFGDTGETLERELTKEEIAQRELDAKEAAKIKAAEAAKAAARSALLEKLGITADEAKLLLG